MTLVGPHLRNESHLKPLDTALYQAAHFNGAVAWWYQDPLEVLSMGVAPSNVLVRLRDSVWDGNKVPSYQDLSADWVSTIARWSAKGFHNFVIDNEPNLSWASQHTPAGQSQAQVWSWLLRRALLLTQAALLFSPYIFNLHLTPFSHPSLHTDWMDECFTSEVGLPSVASYCRGAAAHCYWQAEADMGAGWAGKEYEYIHARTGLPVFITEAGCSSTADTLNKQIRDYPLYITQCRAVPYINFLTFFILGYDKSARQTWELFDLSAPVIASIGGALP